MRTARTVRSSTPTRRWPRRRRRPSWPNGSPTGPGRTRPARPALARTYNDRFNSLVLRSYDDAQLSLPGLALTFRPRPHQVAAVARMIGEPAVLLAHEVGAGKTAEMIMGVTELRRLGLVRKPAVVVPNHMLEQFAREWLQLYPQAKVLAAGQEDLQRDRRREFVARCATGNWDGIVMSRSAFERIPLSAREQQAYLDRELDQMRAVDPGGQEAPTASRSSGSKARCCAPRNGCAPSSTRPRTRASPSRRPASTTCASTRRTATRTCAPRPTSATRRSTGPSGPPTWT